MGTSLHALSRGRPSGDRLWDGGRGASGPGAAFSAGGAESSAESERGQGLMGGSWGWGLSCGRAPHGVSPPPPPPNSPSWLCRSISPKPWRPASCRARSPRPPSAPCLAPSPCDQPLPPPSSKPRSSDQPFSERRQPTSAPRRAPSSSRPTRAAHPPRVRPPRTGLCHGGCAVQSGAPGQAALLAGGKP